MSTGPDIYTELEYVDREDSEAVFTSEKNAYVVPCCDAWIKSQTLRLFPCEVAFCVATPAAANHFKLTF